MTENKLKVAKRKTPWLMYCLIAGVALIIGSMVGDDTGPAVSVGQDVSESEYPEYPELLPLPVESELVPLAEPEPPSRTPASESPGESLIISNNSGIVNSGIVNVGTHYHRTARTPARVVERVVERPVIVERVVEQPVVVERVVERQPKIWTRPGVPADSRLGRTLLTLKRFEDAGVRIYVEEN